jgi:hypothetical protein
MESSIDPSNYNPNAVIVKYLVWNFSRIWKFKPAAAFFHTGKW